MAKIHTGMRGSQAIPNLLKLLLYYYYCLTLLLYKISTSYCLPSTLMMVAVSWERSLVVLDSKKSLSATKWPTAPHGQVSERVKVRERESLQNKHAP